MFLKYIQKQMCGCRDKAVLKAYNTLHILDSIMPNKPKLDVTIDHIFDSWTKSIENLIQIRSTNEKGSPNQ